MIYRLFNEYVGNEYRYPEGSMADIIQKANAMIDLNQRTSDSDDYIYEIPIPTSYARGESNRPIYGEEAFNVEHYSLFIFKQIGEARVKKDTIILCKFPKSDRIFSITLYYNGGVTYDKTQHKYMLRVTDELDRRIVEGFCLKYWSSLINACHEDVWKGPDKYLMYKACSYTHKDMPVRIKHGIRGNSFNPHYESTIDNSIFNSVALI